MDLTFHQPKRQVHTHILVKDTVSFNTSKYRYPIIIGDQRHLIIKLTCLINEVLRTRLQVVQFNDSKYHTSEQSSTFHIDAIPVIKGGGGRGLFFF